METAENTTKLIRFVSEKFESDELDNDSLVQLTELCGNYLNLCTISEYAKKNGMSYNGVKHHRQIVKLFNHKFVIDNE